MKRHYGSQQTHLSLEGAALYAYSSSDPLEIYELDDGSGIYSYTVKAFGDPETKPMTEEELVETLLSYNQYESLYEATGQESGLVVYDNAEGIICNWSHGNGLPRLLCDEPVYDGRHTLSIVRKWVVKDAAKLLDGDVDLIYDRNDDAEAFFEAGTWTVYIVTDGEETVKVYCPSGWN